VTSDIERDLGKVQRRRWGGRHDAVDRRLGGKGRAVRDRAVALCIDADRTDDEARLDDVGGAQADIAAAPCKAKE
jgi:hypothetical protein